MDLREPQELTVQPAPTITVVVLNWNGEALLPACLDALRKQDLPRERWQTWVVDNDSGDGSLELLAREYPEVHVVRNDANLGFAGGNNVAMRQAPTPLVVLLNNDAHPEPDWLRRLAAPLLEPGGERLAATTSRLLFEPRFLELGLDMPGFSPPADSRELGALVSRVQLVAGRSVQDVTESVLWEHGAYGPEEVAGQRFRWTRPRGRLLVPIGDRGAAPDDLQVVLTARAERPKPLRLTWPDGGITVALAAEDADHHIPIPPGTRLVDVVNNAGGIFHAPGYGADRGYQEVDRGQYDRAEEVFLLCGAATCLRAEALREVGVFDDSFFMYYEDTDLSWRLRAAGWSIRYVPDAVVRHLHSASAVEWSPFFTFHVERNRLLLLAKNAPRRLAAGQALRFQLTTASMLRRALLTALRERHRPPVRPTLLRLRVTGSYLRHLPSMLRQRWTTARPRAAGRDELLEPWFGPPKQ
jgi:GT2 family glycosyltransferase